MSHPSESATPAGAPVRLTDDTVSETSTLFQYVSHRARVGTRTKLFESTVRSPGVRLILKEPDSQKILLTHEFRYDLQKWDWRLPGGRVFDKLKDYLPHYFAGNHLDQQIEAAIAAAHEEAHQEAGADLRSVRFLYRTSCEGKIVWDLYYFEAEVEELGNADPEPGEVIRRGWFTPQEIAQMLRHDEIGEERTKYLLFRHVCM